MNPAQPTSPALSLFVPACLAVFAVCSLVVGFVVRRRRPESLVDNICFFLATQALVYAVSMLIFVFGPHGLEEPADLFPLLLSLVLVILGARLRSPVLWVAGLATPGLGYFCQKLWVLLPFSSGIVFVFPEDPLWFLGLAALIFAMSFSKRWRTLWEDMEPVHTAVSCIYVLAGIWLPAAGKPGLLGVLGLSPHIWAGVLVVAALITLWIAKTLRDPILLGAGAAGGIAGVVSFLMQYPT